MYLYFTITQHSTTLKDALMSRHFELNCIPVTFCMRKYVLPTVLSIKLFHCQTRVLLRRRRSILGHMLQYKEPRDTSQSPQQTHSQLQNTAVMHFFIGRWPRLNHLGSKLCGRSELSCAGWPPPPPGEEGTSSIHFCHERSVRLYSTFKHTRDKVIKTQLKDKQ